jgi:hypothetical protein
MKTCDFINRDDKVINTITWDGKQLAGVEADSPILECKAYDPQTRQILTAQDNPGEWFEQLPAMYSGTYFRAKMRGGEKESDMITDNNYDSAARLHQALDRVLDRRRTIARDESEGRANVARKAWQTRHETGGTKELAKSEGEGPKQKMKTQNIKPFGWAAKQSERKSQHPDQKPERRPDHKPPVKPV